METEIALTGIHNIVLCIVRNSSTAQGKHVKYSASNASRAACCLGTGVLG